VPKPAAAHPEIVVDFIPGLVFEEVQAAHRSSVSIWGTCEEIMPVATPKPRVMGSPWGSGRAHLV